MPAHRAGARPAMPGINQQGISPEIAPPATTRLPGRRWTSITCWRAPLTARSVISRTGRPTTTPGSVRYATTPAPGAKRHSTTRRWAQLIARLATLRIGRPTTSRDSALNATAPPPGKAQLSTIPSPPTMGKRMASALNATHPEPNPGRALTAMNRARWIINTKRSPITPAAASTAIRMEKNQMTTRPQPARP